MKLNFDKKIYSLAWSHPRLPLLLVKVKLDGAGKEYERPSEYHLLELDEGFRIKAGRVVLAETQACRYELFCSWTEGRLLFAERTDTNRDGVADYKDKRSQAVRSLDLRTGATSRVIPGLFELQALAGDPGGLIYLVDCRVENREYHLCALDPRAGTLVTLAELGGGSWRGFVFDQDLRVAVCQQVLDTTGKDKFYPWQDRSLIHRIDLA